MQLLRTLFWVAIAVAVSAFIVANWTPISLSLWSGVMLDTYLPIPLTAAFLLGFVPYYLLHRATRWSLQRRLSQTERQLAETRSLLSPAPAPPEAAGTIPPSAAPIAVPPGVL